MVSAVTEEAMAQEKVARTEEKAEAKEHHTALYVVKMQAILLKTTNIIRWQKN
jgi:hypothetical protein